MTEHDDTALKALLRQTPPVEPSAGAKRRAINEALIAFDAKKSTTRQGMGFGARLIHTVQAVCEPLLKGKTMKTTYAIAGTLCLGAIGFTLLNTTAIVPFELKENAADVSVVASDMPANKSDAEAKRASIVPQIVAPSAAVSAPIADAEYAAAPPPPAPEATQSPMKAKLEGASAAAGNAMVGRRAPTMPSGAMLQAESMVMPSPEPMPYVVQQPSQDKFSSEKPNSVKQVKADPVSTFSVDVDTASYSFVRSSLNNNTLPSADAVRVEELINYFPYSYDAPESKAEPFRANTAVFNTPWNANTKILHIGIKGYELKQTAKPRSNLVFLLDTSGSMYEPNKLPLVQQSLKLLLSSLDEDDTISIVTYAGSAGVALEPTKAKDKAKIIAALDGLTAGGSTAGEAGIRQAYQLAEQHFDKKGINRVILATDGDFNVGITDPEELKRYVEKKRETGVFLSVLGFGRGNYNDALMQVLAQNGNGNASYIDNLNEARKVLVEEAGSTLFPIAKDVKIQVEFNPKTVAEYRLIGYETRILNREDFNNDKIDAGDIGAGHNVTALYEITPVGSNAKLVDDLRYQADKAEEVKAPKAGDEYAFVKIRYKLPSESKSKLLTYPVKVGDDAGDISRASTEAQFATAVAAFGQKLKGESQLADFSFDEVLKLANASKGEDAFGYRAEFINLVRSANTLSSIDPAPSKFGNEPVVQQ